MLSISAIASSTSYYENNPEKNYYMSDVMSSFYLGKGAAEFELDDKKVDIEVQANLSKGILPDGTTIVKFNPSNHRSGWDMTFSAPKSVSVVALVLKDERFIEAHKQAVKVAMGEIESMASVRVRDEKGYKIVPTENLIVACHNHDTSRELDPQLHTHSLVFNLTKNANGDWQSLSSDKINKLGFSEAIYNNQLAFGSIYRQELRNQVEALGFETISVGKGLWEIKDVPTEQFSTRRSQIVAEIGEDATAKEREKVTIKTRKFKTTHDKDKLFNEWNHKLKETGFDRDTFYKNAENNLSEKGIMLSEENKHLYAQAIDKAISILSNEKSQINYQELVHVALSLSPHETGSVQNVREQIDLKIQSTDIIPIDKDKSTFISQINLDKEKVLTKIANKLTDKNNRFTHSVNVDDKGINQYFKQDKQVAILSGKVSTKTLIDDLKMIEQNTGENNRNLIVGVATKKEQQALTGLGMVNVKTFSEINKLDLNNNDFIFVPFGEKLTLNQANELLNQTDRSSNSLLLLDGKSKVGSGNPIDVLKNAGIKNYDLTHENIHKVAVSVHSVPEKKTRYKALVTTFLDDKKDENNIKRVIVANTIPERELITKEIREQLKDRKELGTESISLKTLIPVYMSEKKRVDIQSYERGMILEGWNEKEKRSFLLPITSIDKKNKNIICGDNTISMADASVTFNLLEPRLLDVNVNESLIALGNMNSGIKSGEPLVVTSINKESHFLEVKNTEGKIKKIYTADAHKIGYNYVSSTNSMINKDRVVYTTLNSKDINNRTIQSLTKVGENIKIFTAVDKHVAERKLEKEKNIDIVSNKVKGSIYDNVDEAILGRKESLLNEHQKALHIGIQLVSNGEVDFDVIQAKEQAFKSDKNLSFNRINDEFSKMVKSGDIILHSSGKAILRETLEQEKIIQSTIAQGIDTEKPLIDKVSINDKKFSHLTKGQVLATKHILTSKDRFIGIQGLAGVGKTTQLKSVLAELKEKRPEITVIGLAPTHKAKHELELVGIQSQTIKSFLIENSTINEDGKQNFKNTVFLIDESSMISNKDTAELYKAISVGGGRGIFSGDNKQLLSVETGASFELQQRYTDLKFSVLNEIVRQSPDLKPAITEMLKGNISKSFSVINSIGNNIERIKGGDFQSSTNITDGKILKELKTDAITHIADDYVSRVPSVRDNTIVISPTNRERESINNAIHDGLKDKGLLGESIVMETLSPVRVNASSLKLTSQYEQYIDKGVFVMNEQYFSIENVDSSKNEILLKNLSDDKSLVLTAINFSDFENVALYEKKHLEISEGDKILLNKTNIDNNFIANSQWKVKSVDSNTSQILLSNEDGQLKTLNLNDNSDKHVDLAYAITAHSSQGGSYDNVIYLASKTASARSYYIGISRAKKHVAIVSHSTTSQLASQFSKIDERKTAIEYLEPNVNFNDIHINMVDVAEIQQLDHSSEIIFNDNFNHEQEHDKVALENVQSEPIINDSAIHYDDNQAKLIDGNDIDRLNDNIHNGAINENVELVEKEKLDNLVQHLLENQDLEQGLDNTQLVVDDTKQLHNVDKDILLDSNEIISSNFTRELNRDIKNEQIIAHNEQQGIEKEIVK